MVLTIVYLVVNIIAFTNNAIKVSDYTYQVQKIVAENNTIKPEYVEALTAMQLKCLNANVSDILLVGGGTVTDKTTFSTSEDLAKNGFCKIQTSRKRGYTTDNDTDISYTVSVKRDADTEEKTGYQFGEVYPVTVVWQYVPYIPYGIRQASEVPDSQELAPVQGASGFISDADTETTTIPATENKLYYTLGYTQNGFNGKDIGYRNTAFRIVSSYRFPCLRYYPNLQG